MIKCFTSCLSLWSNWCQTVQLVPPRSLFLCVCMHLYSYFCVCVCLIEGLVDFSHAANECEFGIKCCRVWEKVWSHIHTHSHSVWEQGVEMQGSPCGSVFTPSYQLRPNPFDHSGTHFCVFACFCHIQNTSLSRWLTRISQCLEVSTVNFFPIGSLSLFILTLFLALCVCV